MANIKISELTALTPPDAADLVPVTDSSASQTKRTTVGEIVGIVNGDVDVADDGTATISELPVSKLQDGDARQLLQTDAAGTGVEWTSNVDVPGTLDVTGATTLDSTLGVSGQSTLASAAISDLTSGRVVLAGTSGELEDNAGLTFNGTQLDVDGDILVADGNRMEIDEVRARDGAGLKLFDDGGVGIFVKDGGSVGIGTSSVSAPLHVKYADATTTGLVNGLKLQQGSATNGNRLSLVFSSLDNFTVAGVNGVIETHSGAEANNVGRLEFYTKASGGSVTERMRITNDGKVGVGATNVDELLHVESDGATPKIKVESTLANSSPGFRVTNDARSYDIRIDGTNDNLQFYDATASEGRVAIDSSGRLLVNTSSAVDTSDGILEVASSGNTSISLVRNDTTVSSGNTLSQIKCFGNDDNGSYEECGRIAFIADGDHATGDKPTRLVFSTTADGASSPTEHVRINSAGTTTIWSTSAPMLWGRNETSGGVVGLAYYNTATSTTSLTGQVFRVMCDGDVENANNAYGAISDASLKENIVDANSQWADIKALAVRNYNFKAETGLNTHTQIGLVAQEVELVSPGLVGECIDDETGTTTKTVSYSVLYMKAVKALQEAMERIETLEAKVAALESA